MKLTNLFSMLGGLALFLYGMNMMSNGLEMAAGDKMKTILEKLTSNRILGVLVGALVTAIIQSSSATTVMVVGFVNSGLIQKTVVGTTLIYQVLIMLVLKQGLQTGLQAKEMVWVEKAVIYG